MITPQAVFNAAWAHFVLADNGPAISGKTCRYLTSDGKKCAVGLCIPDGHPAQTLLTDARALSLKYPNLFGDYSGWNKWYAFQLELHDKWVDPDTLNWREIANTQEKRMVIYKEIAQRYNLTIPPDPTV